MKKKLLSLLLVIAVIMTSVSMGFGSLVATAGAAGGGVEAINAFSLVQNGNATGTSFTASFTIKSKVSGYQIKVNSVTASIRYAQNETDALSTYTVSSAAGKVIGTGGQSFSFTGTISAGLAGLIRYECNYDLLDSNGNVVYAGMTGYGYGAVSANGQQTGGVGTSTGEPGTKKPYYYDSFAQLNSCYVQITDKLTFGYKTSTAWQAGGTSSKTSDPKVESGTAPSTISFSQIQWPGVGAFSGGKTKEGTWCTLAPPASGYYDFTVFVYSPNSNDLHANVKIYQRTDDDKADSLAKLNEYLGAGLEKSYYESGQRDTLGSWEYYVYIMDLTALCAMAIPGPNYAYQLACTYASLAATGGYLYDAREALVLVDADYSALTSAYNAFTAIKDNTVEVKTYAAGNEDTGETTLRLYTQASVNAVVNKYNGYNKSLYKYDQKTVDGYTAEIKSMTENLTYSDAVYTYLDIATTEFDNTNGDNYTSQTWGLYEAAVNSAKAVSRSLKANSQNDINSRLQSVVDAKNNLELRPANTDELQTQLAIANVIRNEKNAGTLYEEKEFFDDVWALFDEAYNNALAVEGYKITQQTEVDAAAEQLRLLNEELANYRVLDTTLLSIEVAKDPEYGESNYVESSYQKWLSLINEGYQFMDYADPTKNYSDEERKTYADLDEMERLIELIKSARENLEKKKADFTELRSVVAQIPSEEELALYKVGVVDDIKKVVAKIDYGATFDRQNEVKGWTEELEAALAQLVYDNYKDADYSGVEAAIDEAEALDRNEYANFAIVDEAINAVVRGKKIDKQDEVDAMEKAIRDAIAKLGFVPANYDDVRAAIAEAEAVENKEWYSNYYRVENIIANIDWNVTLENQEQVNGYAAAIRQAIEDLKYKEADYSEVTAAVAEARSLEPLSDFSEEFSVALNEAVAAVQAGYTIDKQAEVDAMADRINAVLATAEDNLNRADYTKVNVAIAYAEGYNNGEYKDYDKIVQPVIDAIDWDLKCRDTKDKQHVKIMQDQIQAIYDAVGTLELKEADYTAVNDAIDAAREKYEDNAYAEFPYSQESIDYVEAVIDSVDWGHNIREQSKVDAYVTAIEDAVKNLKYARADYSELDAVIDEYEALERDRYTTETLEAVDDYVLKIDMNITVDKKDQVAAYVEGLRELLDKLEYLPADYTRITNAENDFKALIKENRDYYYEDDIDAVEAALEAVEYGLTKEYQDRVNDMADAVESALNALKANMKPADLTALYQARDAANAKYESMQKTGLKIDMNTYYVLLDELAKVAGYNEYTKIQDQAAVDSLTEAIIAATEGLEYEFQIIWDDSGLITEGSGKVGEGSYIYGFEEGAMSEDARELLPFVGAAKLEIIETANGFGTGTTIKFKSTKDGSTLAEYTVLVFGDANGDAVIDTFDVAYIAEVANSGETPDAVTLRVLDFEVDGVIDAFDVNHVISYANMDATLKQDGSMLPEEEV